MPAASEMAGELERFWRTAGAEKQACPPALGPAGLFQMRRD